MTKFARIVLLTSLLPAGSLSAQVASPSPLTGPLATAATVPGGWIVAEGRANAALQAGFPATAAAIYREVLRDDTLPAENRHRVTLALVTAVMDAGDLAAAETTLKNYDGPRSAAYQLRVGLLAANVSRLAPARAALAAARPEDLPPADRGWWYYLQAQVAEADNDINRRNAAYQQATAAAVSDLQRTRLELGQESALLRGGTVGEQYLANQRSTMDKYPGQRVGYDATRLYAAGLAKLGRKGEALAVLQRQLTVLPSSERSVADQTLLLIGLIAVEDSVIGRKALQELMVRGFRPETQRIALSLLARGAKTPAAREQLRRDLTELIGAPGQNPIIEDLLLVRAQSALIDRLYAQAEEDARALLERYPGSGLKAAALGVRLSVAWDSGRPRAAAELSVQLRALLPLGRERAELGVLLAEAYFRAKDYRSASDAYDAALREREPPAVVPAGILIFQRVLSDIRADQLDAAAKQLDDMAANPAFDAVNRWQAEWNLVREMQVRGPAQAQAAYARVTRLLAGDAQGVPDELRIRLMWLRAKLSFDNDQLETALKQADELLALVALSTKLEAGFRADVTGTTQLLRAQTLLALKRETEGIAMLDKLRTEYRASKPAQYSYLVQAEHLTQKGDMTGAQVVLISFVDNPVYKDSEYAPLALYEAALNLYRQGLDRQLTEANALLERLINSYPRDDLVFYARLKQGELLRKLNDFGAARQVYEDLVNNFAAHPEVLTAQLQLADCLFAQAANSVVSYESAATIFERLRDLPSAPVDLRVEAGFELGYALAKRSQAAGLPAERDQQIAKAQAELWSVVNDFLLDAAQAAKLGATGRFWISRALLELGQIHEDTGNHDEARRAYQLIVDHKLGGAALARAQLERYRPAAPAKP